MGDRFDVGAGEHGDDAGRRACCTHVDRRDARVRERAAEEHGLQHVIGCDVGDVSAPAGQEAIVFDALHALSDEPGPVRSGRLVGDGHDASPFVSDFMIWTARSTPATIDW